MMPTLLFCLWWLAENSLIHYLTFEFLLSITQVRGRRYLPAWLAANGIAALAAVCFRPPAVFLFSVLFLAAFAKIILKLPVSDLIVPVTVIATLCTLKEGISALILSWLSVSFRSPTGGIFEQLLVPLLLDAILLAALRVTRKWHHQARRSAAPAYLCVLMPPCAFAVLSIRWGLRLDRPDFEPYLAELDVGIRLFVLCSIAGLAIVVFTAFAAFCGLARLSDREKLLCGQFDAAEQRIVRYAAFQHDIDNHLLVLSGLLREKSFAQAERYAGQLRASSGRLPAGIFTGRPALDVLLKEKLGTAQDGQITAACAINIPKDFGVEDTDLCALFFNILDNAIAASLKETPERRSLSLSAQVKSQFLVVEAVNAASGSGPVVFGTGLTNIRHIAENYHGTMETELDGGRFRISVLLCSR